MRAAAVLVFAWALSCAQGWLCQGELVPTVIPAVSVASCPREVPEGTAPGWISPGTEEFN